MISILWTTCWLWIKALVHLQIFIDLTILIFILTLKIPKMQNNNPVLCIIVYYAGNKGLKSQKGLVLFELRLVVEIT